MKHAFLATAEHSHFLVQCVRCGLKLSKGASGNEEFAGECHDASVWAPRVYADMLEARIAELERKLSQGDVPVLGTTPLTIVTNANPLHVVGEGVESVSLADETYGHDWDDQGVCRNCRYRVCELADPLPDCPPHLHPADRESARRLNEALNDE